MTDLLSQHTALYTPLDVEYSQVLSGPYEDLSCAEDDFVVVAAQKAGRAAGFWRPMVAFGNEDRQKCYIEGLWQEFPDIVYEDYLVDGALSPISKFLLCRGYRATPHFVQVIDLRQSESALRGGLRKSYRSLVNKDDGVEQCDVAMYQRIHESIKKSKRPQATWDIQARMIPLCFHDAGHCGTMFYVGPRWAYYASAARDGVHACIWASLLELKRRGVEFVEMGEQVYQSDDPKAIGIARLKSGFGGSPRVRLILRRPQNAQ